MRHERKAGKTGWIWNSSVKKTEENAGIEQQKRSGE
jgi:hypothetical protein